MDNKDMPKSPFSEWWHTVGAEGYASRLSDEENMLDVIRWIYHQGFVDGGLAALEDEE